MVIHAVFMIDEKTAKSDDATLLRECKCRCIQSAEDSIDLIYSTFRTDNYFQTWYVSSAPKNSSDDTQTSHTVQLSPAKPFGRWYNSTYTLFAVSILLARVFRQPATTQQGLESIFIHVDRAIMVLRAMDDCLVARNATAIIKRTLARAKKVPQPALFVQPSASFQDTDLSGTLRPPANMEYGIESDNGDKLLQSSMPNGNTLDETVDELDWLDAYPFDDSEQASFWTEWAHEIDSLGT
jgi:hypothetical protein